MGIFVCATTIGVFYQVHCQLLRTPVDCLMSLCREYNFSIVLSISLTKFNPILAMKSLLVFWHGLIHDQGLDLFFAAATATAVSADYNGPKPKVLLSRFEI